MGDVIQLRDYHLKRLTEEAAKLSGQLVEFAKTGQPSVANVDPFAGAYVPEGIDGLLYETSVGWVGPDAGC